MCGIVGFIAARGTAPPDSSKLGEAVLALAHRGPSASGTYESEAAALGSTRLSIIDLAGGNQPMWNEDRSLVVVYNGEIWNHCELRDDLVRRGHRFANRSDTEVLLHAYEEWGSSMTEQLDGMFAFGIWDTRREELFLARDRLGKKPLYLSHTERGVAFGSDARSVLIVTGMRPAIAEEGVGEYLFQRYLVAPRTLFSGIDRVPPGHQALYDRNELSLTRYWMLEPPEQPVPLVPSELRGLLRKATERRLMSDVPVGVFLSGGVDSTAVLSFAADAYPGQLATFTVGFDDPVYDERPRAGLAARHFGTEHHELGIDGSAFLDAWSRLAWYRDEPIAEASEIPLLLLSEFAGRHVRVALSGDGGDELFGGYPKYRADALLRSGGRASTLALGGLLGLLARKRTHRQLRRAVDTLGIDEPLVRWVSWFRTADADRLESLLAPRIADGPIPERLAANLGALLAPYAGLDEGRRMLLGDFWTYLPDNMLLRSDKVLMAGSIEGRMPLLDRELVERASAAPARSRSGLLRSKRLLRRALEESVPRALRGGPKRGFPVPIECFLVSEGRERVEQLLLSERSLSRGIFRPDALRAAVRGPVSERLGDSALFVLASFELWARANVDQVTTSPPGAAETLWRGELDEVSAAP